MQIFENLHAFIWESTTVNNCNTFFIDGPTRVLIDPGLTSQFEPVQKKVDPERSRRENNTGLTR